MATFAILRVCRLHDALHIDIAWMALWHYLAATIPAIILPIAAFQFTAFVDKHSKTVRKDVEVHMEVLADEQSIAIEKAIDDLSQEEDFKRQSTGHDSNANAQRS